MLATQFEKLACRVVRWHARMKGLHAFGTLAPMEAYGFLITSGEIAVN